VIGFTKTIIKILKKNNCEIVRHGKGDHDIWKSPHSNINFTVDHIIKSRHTANGILKQAGINHKI